MKDDRPHMLIGNSSGAAGLVLVFGMAYTAVGRPMHPTDLQFFLGFVPAVLLIVGLFYFSGVQALKWFHARAEFHEQIDRMSLEQAAVVLQLTRFSVMTTSEVREWESTRRVRNDLNILRRDTTFIQFVDGYWSIKPWAVGLVRKFAKKRLVRLVSSGLAGLLCIASVGIT